MSSDTRYFLKINFIYILVIKHLKTKLRKTIPFTISSERIIYSETNLTKFNKISAKSEH